MPLFLISLVTRAGVPQRFARIAAWIVAGIIVLALCGAAVALFREWIAHGKEEAVRVDQQDVTIEAANLVINASSAATANQMERDDAFANSQEELRDEVATKGTADPVGPATASVLERMRQQQAAGRRR
jgi:hypothetical protein